MSTLVQIESAVAELPMQDQLSLLSWLQVRLKNVTKAESKNAVSGSMQVLRQLQAEVALTADDAAAWKKAVADARR